MSKTQPARGMRDFLPDEVRKRNYVIGIIKEVYEKYGFEPLETPSVENLETLTGKYGEEGNQLMFKILKRGEKLQEELTEGKITSENQLSDLALRYDLTVPLARVVANYKNELPKFFKRYQIQPVWRADRPAKGRFREFYQCDVDAIGSTSMLVEAELISAVSEIFERLGFDDFVIKLNHRQVLEAILNTAGIPSEKHIDALVALDKLDKIGSQGVAKELQERGIKGEAEIKLLSFFEFFLKDSSKKFFDENQKINILELQKKVKTSDDAIRILFQTQKDIQKLKTNNLAPNDEELNKFQKNLDFVEHWLTNYKDFLEKLKSNFSEEEKLLVERGIEDKRKNKQPNKQISFHDTQSVFLLDIWQYIKDERTEGIIELSELIEFTSHTNAKNKIKIDATLARGLSYYTGVIMEINVPDFAGSLAGGGRYDGLIGMFGKEQIPAVGFSIGLERILVVMEQRGMFPENLTANSADVMITNWSDAAASESLKLAGELRANGLRVLVYPEADKLGKQFKYADSINIPFVCVLGESEIAENKVTLKNMKSGEQETVSREEVSDRLKG